MGGRRIPGPSYGGVWGLNSLGFEGPRVVWSVWVDGFGPKNHELDQGFYITKPSTSTFQQAVSGHPDSPLRGHLWTTLGRTW